MDEKSTKSNHNEENEFQEKLNTLNDHLEEIKSQNYLFYEKTIKKQLSTITIIFSIIAVFFLIIAGLVGYVSVSSSRDIDEAINRLQEDGTKLQDKLYTAEKEIRNDLDRRIENIEKRIEIYTAKSNQEVKSAISEMEQNFDKLSGEELKKPIIEILRDGLPLEGQIIELKVNTNDEILLPQFSFRNIGNRQLQIPSINLFVSENITISITGNWQNEELTDDNFKSQFQYYVDGLSDDLSVIKHGETDRMESFKLGSIGKDMELLDCKMVVYYDAGPSKASFKIKLVR